MKIKSVLGKFAYETFRPHSKKEYAELFARGNGGEEGTPYPWFYARVLLFSLLIFTLLCLSYSLSNINFIAVAVVGGVFADLTFIVLLYELYPKRDLSLMIPVLVLFVGGLLSSVFAEILYGIAGFGAPFADQAWTAFVEETSKVLATIIILLVLKNRNPFYCFIIGAAVGGGFSAFENMWYIYGEGFMWNGLSEAMQTGLLRALGTPFSHAAWAGAFGWAISGDKPWRRWQPYAVYAFNFTMHFFVNFPLMTLFSGWKGYPISAVTGILSFVFIIFLIAKCRRELSSPAVINDLSEMRTYLKINSEDKGYSGGNYKIARFEFIANALAAAAIFCFSVMLLGPTCVYGGRTNFKEYRYKDLQTCIDIAQSGLTFAPDFEREYVEYSDPSENYAYTWANGQLTYVVQREQYGEYFYRYSYGYLTHSVINCGDYGFYYEENHAVVRVEPDENGDIPETVGEWELLDVGLEYGGRTVYWNAAWQYPDVGAGEGRQVYYFKINTSVYSIYYEPNKNGSYVLLMREQTEVRLIESVVLSGVFCAAFIGCGVAYIIYKTKARRKKNAQ